MNVASDQARRQVGITLTVHAFLATLCVTKRSCRRRQRREQVALAETKEAFLVGTDLMDVDRVEPGGGEAFYRGTMTFGIRSARHDPRYVILRHTLSKLFVVERNR